MFITNLKRRFTKSSLDMPQLNRFNRLVYLAIICLCFSQGKLHLFLGVFQPFGKLVLICNLLQSLAGILIYRGPGLGLR